MENTETDTAKSQARAQFESIAEMMEAITTAGDDNDAREDAEQAVWDDALSVEVRSGWAGAGTEKLQPEEYKILLCTGGPAVQVVGDLDEYNQPETARLQYQDWFTPWTDYPLTQEEEEVLLSYARQFYFGE